MQATLERLRQRREETGGEGGFTLIELLIVIVILGILAAIVVFAVQNLSGTSAQSACNSDYKTVETAVEAYKANNGVYPNTGTPGVAAGATNGVGALMYSTTTNSGYLKDVPFNSGHYLITVSVDGKGTVGVLSGSNVPSGVTSANVGTQAITNAVASCSGVG